MNNSDKAKVGEGMFVAFSYRLTNAADGSLLFEAKENAPDVMVYGATPDVIPGLLATLKGLGAGDKFSVTLPPEVAFGPRMDENVMELEREIFVRDGELAEEVVVGAELPMMTQEGFTVKGKILDITDKIVKMDFNHPFAGMTVEFNGKVEEVPQNENTPFHPYSPYAVAKLYGFWIVKEYREAYNMYCCSGILFNHESERRGETFVTRKITLAAARIAQGKQCKLYLGNLSSLRDWGYAKDYVECMWLMLQNDKPEDFVIATGIQHSVRDFCYYAFKHVGIELEFIGEGADCLLYTSPSPRDRTRSRMPSSA